ncbi:Signal peptidase complex subunit 1 [Sparganum proliferum]
MDALKSYFSDLCDELAMDFEGYFKQQLWISVAFVLCGFVLSAILTLLPWPIYRRHPLNWKPLLKAKKE